MRLSPVMCLLKLIPRALTLTPSLVPGGACPPGSWIWQLTSSRPSCWAPVEEVAWTTKVTRPPQKSGGSGIRSLSMGHLAAAVELERDEPLVEREGAGFEHGRAGHQRVGS